MCGEAEWWRCGAIGVLEWPLPDQGRRSRLALRATRSAGYGLKGLACAGVCRPRADGSREASCGLVDERGQTCGFLID